LRERFAIDHYVYADETGHSDVGYHKQVTLPVLAADPDAVASAVRLYTKDVGGKAELFWIDEDSNVVQITTAGALKANVVPSGLIGMWHGTIANIPTGYVICDGNNSTPNLLAKMVRGVATAATNPGTTGGSDTLSGNTDSHVLTEAEIPAHTHVDNTATSGGSWGGSDGSASCAATTTVTGSTGGGTGHVHGLSVSCVPAHYEVAFIMKS
jgi:hypothetical protein